MKLPAGRVEAFIRAPDPAVRAALLYGPDQGLARERAQRLLRSIVDPPNDPFRVAELNGADLARDPARLADEALARSLTGGRRAVLVRDGTDALAVPLKQVLDGPDTDTLIIIEAGDLGKRSILRNVCEKEARAAALACYLPDANDAARLAREALNAAGLTLDRAAEGFLAERLAGDRQLARRDIEKLIVFMGQETRVDLAAVEACIGDAAEQSIEDLALAVADGDRAEAGRILDKAVAEGTSAVAVLRGIQNHFYRLHLAARRVAGGGSIEDTMKSLKPPVFFKVEPRFRNQVQRWSPGRLGDALAYLIEAEAACKRTGMPDATVCAQMVFRIAGMVRGR